MVKKKYLPLTISAVLLTMLVALGAFSIYVSRVTGQNRTEAAPFVFTAELLPNGDDTPIQLSTAGSKEIGTLAVSNTEDGVTCGVRTKYTIQLNSDVALPDTVTPVLKLGENSYLPAETSSDRKQFIFESEDFVFGFEQPETETFIVALNWENTTGAQNLDVVMTASATAEQVD